MLLNQCLPAQDEDVVCVVGNSGVSKTTLVREAYQDAGIRGHFAIRIWTSFPPDTSDWTILPQIYQVLDAECSALDDSKHETGQKEEQRNPDKNRKDNAEWKDELEKLLGEKRYLLVIDCRQVSITKWQRIRCNIPKGGQGSRIVLITATTDEYTDKEHTIHLNPLKAGDCKRLFDRIIPGIIKNTWIQIADSGIFVPNNATENIDTLGDKIDKIGIDKITGGLPLALVLLAQLLQTMEQDQRIRVFDHISKSNKEAKRLERILSLCLNDLSHELKSCFLYLAGFPENKLISAQQLVRLWMAEGLLTPKDGKKMEKIGHRYLKELIARGLIQLVAKDARGNVESVAIHEHIHAFLRLEAREASFLEVHYGYYVPAAATVRRLSLQNYKNKFSALTNRLPKLRSVMSFFEEEDQDHNQQENWRPSKEESKVLDMHGLLGDSPFLRIINLEGLDIGRRLPKKIGDVVHLRYLSVRSKKLRKVPGSIGNLSNLQTLDVRGTGVRKLPDAFWKIGTLRHVLGTKLCFPEPKSAGDLKHLETLETASLENDIVWDGTIMKKMFSLRILHVVGLKVCHKNALKLALDELNYLVDLTLSGEVIKMDIKSHHMDKLVSMKLEGKLEIIKDDEGSSTSSRGRKISLPNLSELVLKSTHVDSDFIGKLALLQNLTSLSLLNVSFDEAELVFPSDGFENLKFLRVSHLDDNKKLVVRCEMKKLETFEPIAFNGSIEAKNPGTLSQKINKTFYGKEIEQIKDSQIVRA